MSYDPSHRKPPRQERWPQATPPTGWPSYRDDDPYRDGEYADARYAAHRSGAYQATAGYRRQAGYQGTGYQGTGAEPGDRGYQSAVATDTSPPGMNGYGSAADFGPASGYGDARDGYGDARESYGDARESYGDARDSYGDARDSYGYPSGGHPSGGYPSGGYVGRINGYAGAVDDFAEATDGYGDTTNGYAGTVGAYPSAANAYADGGDRFAGGYDWTDNDHGYAEVRDGFAEPDVAGSAAYLGPGSYTEPGLADPMLADPMLADPMLADPMLADPVLAAPDAGVDPYRWQADRDLRREARRRGLGVGAVTGFLAVAVAIGVSTLIAGFIRPQASPMAALGSVFVDRTPAALKNVVLQHFGTHGRTVLLLGMYAAIAVLAVGIGLLARRGAAPGVASLAAFSLLAAFVTMTRPGGRVSDIAPAIIGGMAGIAALLWLMHASAPLERVAPARQTRGTGRRRAR